LLKYGPEGEVGPEIVIVNEENKYPQKGIER